MIPVVLPAQAAQLDKNMIEKKRIAGLLLMEQAADEVARRPSVSIPPAPYSSFAERETTAATA